MQRALERVSAQLLMLFYIQLIEYHAPVSKLHFNPLRPSFNKQKKSRDYSRDQIAKRSR